MKACPTPQKRKYPGRASAKAAIIRGAYTSGTIRVYLCDCGSWHHTTQAKPLKQRRRR